MNIHAADEFREHQIYTAKLLAQNQYNEVKIVIEKLKHHKSTDINLSPGELQ
jgi:hypothetical protein